MPAFPRWSGCAVAMTLLMGFSARIASEPQSAGMPAVPLSSPTGMASVRAADARRSAAMPATTRSPAKGMPVNPPRPGHPGCGEPRGSETIVPWTGVKEGEKKGAVPPRPNHVVVVILENEHRASVMGSRHAPYLNKLAARGANLTQSYGDPTMQAVELAIYVRNKVVHPPNNIRSVEWPSGRELLRHGSSRPGASNWASCASEQQTVSSWVQGEAWAPRLSRWRFVWTCWGQTGVSRQAAA